MRSIAASIGRPASTVSREIRRNGGPRRYRGHVADQSAWAQGRRPKLRKLAATPRLRAIVEEKLEDDWSPQQISRWLRRVFADDPELQVSHETIYMSLFVQTRGGLRKELANHLRSKRTIRRGKTATEPGHGKGQIVGAVHISERPAGKLRHSLVRRCNCETYRSCYAELKWPCAPLGPVIRNIAPTWHRQPSLAIRVFRHAAIARHIQTLPVQLRKTLTWDRGNEMAKHAQFTIDTGVKVYFCDPRSPWQRGSNENTNGLLRQYFPKRTSLAGITQADLDEIAAKLNRRPRRAIDWVSPSEKLAESLQ